MPAPTVKPALVVSTVKGLLVALTLLVVTGLPRSSSTGLPPSSRTGVAVRLEPLRTPEVLIEATARPPVT